MQIIKNHDKAANVIFVISLLIHLGVMCQEFSIWDIPIRGRFLQAAFILGCVKILMTYYEKYEWFVMLALGALGTIAYACSKEKYFIYVVVLLFSAKNVDLKGALYIMLWVTVLSMIVVPALAIAGVGGQMIDVRDYGRGAVESRFCFGFSHANNYHGTLWYVVCLALMVYKDKFELKHYGIIMAINTVLFLFTRSRTGFLLTTMALLFGLAYKYKEDVFFEKTWAYIVGAAAFLFTIILSIVSVNTHKRKYGPLLTSLNDATTGRLWMSYKCTSISEWRAFVAAPSNGYSTDNGFVKLPMCYGTVAGLAFIALICVMFYLVAKKRDGILLGVVLLSVLYTFMEGTYTVNDAYLIANPLFIVAMVLIGGQPYSREVESEESYYRY